MRWLAFGTYDVRNHPRVAVLIEGLRAAGDDVVEVNVPLPLDTAGRVAMLRQPWRLPVLAGKVGRCWAALAVGARREMRRGRPDAVLVGYLGHFDVRLARRLFGRTPIALDHLVSAAGTARDRGLAGSAGAKARLLAAIDDGALRQADVVVVDTPEHERALPAGAARKAVVVPVGAGEVWFEAGRRAVEGHTHDDGASGRSDAPGNGRASGGGGPGGGDAAGDRAEAPLRVVFVGLFTPLQGTRTLGAALGLLADDPDIRVTMVGRGQEYDACRALAASNTTVTWRDWVPGEELPAFVAAHDVSLGIFGGTEKARNVVPTKVFQGAAAGCALVTSDTPPQRAALGDAAVFVPSDDAPALAAALRRLAADRATLAALRAAARERADEAFTAAAVVAPLVERARTLVADRMTSA